MDERIRQAVHDLKEVLAEKRKHVFRANVVDQANRPLASGEALLEGDHRVFWPDPPRPKDILPSNVIIVRQSDGTQTAVSNFRPCDAPSNPVHHYHFRIV